MDPARWRRVETLFHQALERDAADRAGFLDDACAGEPDVRREVEQWLAADGQPSNPVAAAVAGAIGSFDAGIEPGTRIGPYEVVALHGEGGMGRVYRARRSDDVFLKEVAIKIVRYGFDDDALLRRFERERRILARLDHPNIARVLDGGTTGDGRPYLVMEFIEGTPITEYCRANELTLRQRLELFLPICAAVAHAHDNLVIHRDIKPGNILIDRQGSPKLLDFGISKLLQADGPEPDSPLTQSMTPLTPQYASPEQIQGEVITTRSDVYSLGTVLYEVLTGLRAHHIDKLTPRAIDQAIAVNEAPAPSTVVEDGALRRGLEGDVDTIVMRALSKEPGRRYQSAAALAEDIRRHLHDLPVLARPDTTLYRVRKFVRRHRTLVSAAAAVFVALAVGIAVAVRQAQVARAREEQVRSLAKVFLFDVHDKVRDLPGATGTRQFIVETAVRYLDAMAGSRPTEPAMLRELADGYVRVGDIQGGDSRGANLGNLDAALASYQKAAAVLDSLIEHDGANRAALMDRVRVQQQIAEMEAGRTGMRDAVATLASAVERGRQLLRQYPDDREVRQLVADVLMSTGQRQRLNGDLDASLTLTSEALDILRQLAAEPGAGRNVHALVATAESAVGMTQVRLDRLKEGLAHYERAVAANERLLTADPHSVEVRRNLAVDYGHVGDVLGNPALPSLGDAAGAERAFRRMAEINRGLYEADPQDARAAADYVASLLRLGLVVPLSRPDEKYSYYERALATVNGVLARSPGHLGLQQTQATLERLIGDYFRDVDRTRDAVRHYRRSMTIAEPLFKTGVTPSRTWVLAACELARIEARERRTAEAMSVLDAAIKVAETIAARESFGDAVGGSELVPRVYAALSDVHAHAGDPGASEEWRQKAVTAWKALSTRPGFTTPMRREMERLETR